MVHPLQALDDLVTTQGLKAEAEGKDVDSEVRRIVVLITDSLEEGYRYLFVNYNPIHFSMLPAELNKANDMVRYAKRNDPHNLLDYAQLVRKYERYVYNKRQSAVSH